MSANGANADKSGVSCIVFLYQVLFQDGCQAAKLSQMRSFVCLTLNGSCLHAYKIPTCIQCICILILYIQIPIYNISCIYVHVYYIYIYNIYIEYILIHSFFIKLAHIIILVMFMMYICDVCRFLITIHNFIFYILMDIHICESYTYSYL